jgi:hypothetical protein
MRLINNQPASAFQTADQRYLSTDGGVLVENGRIVITTSAGAYSMGGVFVGPTTQASAGSVSGGSTNGSISDGNGHVGCAAAKELCESLYGPATHMRDATEVIRSLQLRLLSASSPQGWYIGRILQPIDPLPGDGPGMSFRQRDDASRLVAAHAETAGYLGHEFGDSRLLLPG